MNISYPKPLKKKLLVQPIHTAIKGRARYKIRDLYQQENFKGYLDSRLSYEPGIREVRANSSTGNILVIFEANRNFEEIASILQNIVLDYRHKISQNNKITSSSLQRLNPADRQLIFLSGTISSLIIGTALLHAYGLDESILLALQKLHSPILDRVMVGITLLGGGGAMLVICLVLVIRELRDRRRLRGTALSLAVASTIGLNYLLKVVFGRARPALWEHIVTVNHHSFPSGHAMGSVVTYGFIAYLLTEQFPEWERQIFVLTVGLIGAIGLSRLYLGVHWPTDVVAGYAVGLTWLTLCILILELWQEDENRSCQK